MTKPTNSQSQKRFQESVGGLFGKNGPHECLFLKSSSDYGVMRNGGRNGARFAPQSFLSTFRKWSQDDNLKDFGFREVEVANPEEENQDFHLAQKKQAQRIKTILGTEITGRIIHLGGGHDHIYPLLTALSENYKNVIVINIDAHADTRTDEDFHSGTPFRQFSEEFAGDFTLIQIGLHQFANSFSTLSKLPKGKQLILWKNEFSVEKLQEIFVEIKKLLTKETLVVFSLDADAMDGSFVPGVSAVNPQGFNLRELNLIWKSYSELPLNHPAIVGIYELNPLYDSLSNISMRSIASFVFETFRK